jgi:hypothetical protein
MRLVVHVTRRPNPSIGCHETIATEIWYKRTSDADDKERNLVETLGHGESLRSEP